MALFRVSFLHRAPASLYASRHFASSSKEPVTLSGLRKSVDQLGGIVSEGVQVLIPNLKKEDFEYTCLQRNLLMGSLLLSRYPNADIQLRVTNSPVIFGPLVNHAHVMVNAVGVTPLVIDTTYRQFIPKSCRDQHSPVFVGTIIDLKAIFSRHYPIVDTRSFLGKVLPSVLGGSSLATVESLIQHNYKGTVNPNLLPIFLSGLSKVHHSPHLSLSVAEELESSLYIQDAVSLSSSRPLPRFLFDKKELYAFLTWFSGLLHTRL